MLPHAVELGAAGAPRLWRPRPATPLPAQDEPGAAAEPAPKQTKPAAVA